MVTRFAASLRTNNNPQAAQGRSTTVSRSDVRFIQHLDSSAHGLVRRRLLIGHFPIHLFPSDPSTPLKGKRSHSQCSSLALRPLSTAPSPSTHSTPCPSFGLPPPQQPHRCTLERRNAPPSAATPGAAASRGGLARRRRTCTTQFNQGFQLGFN